LSSNRPRNGIVVACYVVEMKRSIRNMLSYRVTDGLSTLGTVGDYYLSHASWIIEYVLLNGESHGALQVLPVAPNHFDFDKHTLCLRPGEENTPSGTAVPLLRRAGKLTALSVLEALGRAAIIEDAVVDDSDLSVTYLIVNGGDLFSDRRALVDPHDLVSIDWGNDRAYLATALF